MRQGQALRAVGIICTVIFIACQSSATMERPPAVPSRVEPAVASMPIPPLLDTLAHRLLMIDFEHSRLSQDPGSRDRGGRSAARRIPGDDCTGQLARELSR